MAHDSTLSQLVQGYVDTLDWEDDPDTSPQDREEISKIRGAIIIRKSAREIADEADNVLHEKPADLRQAYKVLLLLRGRSPARLRRLEAALF